MQTSSSKLGKDSAELQLHRLGMLVDSFSEEQSARYAAYRRTNLNKAAIKKLANQVLNQSIGNNVTIVIAGLAKVFVGEIVEKAREIQARCGHTGPLTPDHLRDAYRLYGIETGLVPDARKRRRLFK